MGKQGQPIVLSQPADPGQQGCCKQWFSTVKNNCTRYLCHMDKGHFVYLLLGSNMGDRMSQLSAARKALDKGACRIVQASSVYESTPWGLHDQPDFLNQVLKIETTLTPAQLLSRTQRLEANAGPAKKEKWGPRFLDVDLLFYGDKIINETGLKIPHPALHLRDFTLIPLVELAPDLVHPVLKKTLSELLRSSPDDTTVKKLEEA